MHKEYLCPLCGQHNDSHELALACEEVSQGLKISEREFKYMQIYLEKSTIS